MVEESQAYKRYLLPALKSCLYCGSTDGRLTDEHVVPESLNGFILLPHSSCEQCQRTINRDIENPLFGKAYKAIRDANRYRSKRRKPSFDPTEVTAAVEITTQSGKKYKDLVSVLRYPPPLVSFAYSALPSQKDNFIVRKKASKVEAVPSSAVEKLAANSRVKSVRMSGPSLIIGVFERFLLKVAAGSMVAYSRSSIEKSELPQIILGKLPHSVLYEDGTFCKHIFSVPKQGLTGFKPRIFLWERVEIGIRFLYCTIDIAPHFLANNYFVRIVSLETGPLLEETDLADIV